MARHRVLVLTEMYPPELANTGKFLHGITQALAEQDDVHVLTAQPLYDSRGITAPRHERHGAITIERLPSTTFERHRPALRIVNAATLMMSFTFRGLRRVRSADAVLVVTNPPFMPLLAEMLAATRGIPCVVLVHDVYPHALVAAGITRRNSLVWRLLYPVFSRGFRAADGVIALANDMRRLLISDFGVDEARIVVVPNWGDEDDIRPDVVAGAEMRARLGLSERFVVQVMGNMGRTHGLDVVLDAAERVQGVPEVLFLLVGGGKQAQHVRGEIVRRGLSNVVLVPPCSSADLRGMLNAADVAVITFRPGMAGVSVPSRIYNCLAAGQTLITLADEGAEPTELVREQACGVTVRPSDSEGLANAILMLRDDDASRMKMGARARAVFLERFRYSDVAATWRNYFSDLFAKQGRQQNSGG